MSQQQNRDVIVFFDGLLNWIEVDNETFVAYVIAIMVAIILFMIVNSCLCVVLQTYCGLRKVCMCFPFCCCYMIIQKQKDKKEREHYHRIDDKTLDEFDDYDEIIRDTIIEEEEVEEKKPESLNDQSFVNTLISPTSPTGESKNKYVLNVDTGRKKKE